jgi:predicted RNA binding protein YcfA (HicA-like mRNA interferase family)
MNPAKTLKLARASPGNIRFRDMTGLVESFGFKLARVSGSHHIFAHPHLPELINLQEVQGKCKPYQIKQVLKLVERYNLELSKEP